MSLSYRVFSIWFELPLDEISSIVNFEFIKYINSGYFMNSTTSILVVRSLIIISWFLCQSVLAQESSLEPDEAVEKPDVASLQKQIDVLKNKDVDLDGEKQKFVADEKQNGFKINWRPGPEIKSDNGEFSFAINGRVGYDYSVVNFRDGDGIERPQEKIEGVNLRFLQMGVRGRAFSDFSYRVSARFIDNEVELRLAYVDYDFGKTKIIVGQTRTYNTLDKLTPPPNHAFAERAAFINAMRIKPRVGIAISHHGDNWSVSGGYFFENASSVNKVVDDNNIASARVSFSPRFKNGVGIHFGGSTFYRYRNGNSFDHNYNARPFVKQGNLKPLTSESFNIVSETFYSGEFVVTYKSLAFQTEFSIVENKLGPNEILTTTSPRYQGGYVELSFFPTGGQRIIDGTDGRFNRVDIANPVGSGGFGEIRLAARYDVADLTHEIFGRKQNSIIFAADWYLNELTKIQTNYAHSTIKNAINIRTDIVNAFNTRFLFSF